MHAKNVQVCTHMVMVLAMDLQSIATLIVLHDLVSAAMLHHCSLMHHLTEMPYRLHNKKPTHTYGSSYNVATLAPCTAGSPST